MLPPENPVNGTTSACAENTPYPTHRCPSRRNYLRVRGEYVTIEALEYLDVELPPRARRIPVLAGPGVTDRGTTSACAENTLSSCSLQNHYRNYLRVRGEYTSATISEALSTELPPRARRIRCAPPPGQ